MTMGAPRFAASCAAPPLEGASTALGQPGGPLQPAETAELLRSRGLLGA